MFRTALIAKSSPWLSAMSGAGLKGWRVVSMASTWAGPGAEVSGLPGAGEREVAGL